MQLLVSAGFVAHDRAGKYLYHTVADDDPLLAAMMAVPSDKETLMYTATALTHERRVLIVRALGCKQLAIEELCRLTKISGGAMRRQLEKLESRGFITKTVGKWSLTTPHSILGRRMVELALSDSTPAQVWNR